MHLIITRPETIVQPLVLQYESVYRFYKFENIKYKSWKAKSLSQVLDPSNALTLWADKNIAYCSSFSIIYFTIYLCCQYVSGVCCCCITAIISTLLKIDRGHEIQCRIYATKYCWMV